MLSLEERIADRIARGKENAELNAPVDPETGERRAPTDEEIEAATDKTGLNSAMTAATPADAKKAAKEWKANA